MGDLFGRVKNERGLVFANNEEIKNYSVNKNTLMYTYVEDAFPNFDNVEIDLNEVTRWSFDDGELYIQTEAKMIVIRFFVPMK